MVIYAIGDIHGQIHKLEGALAKVEADGGPDARIVFLGDYVDRGPNSRAVLERLWQGLRDGRNWICLRGNHDRMMALFLKERPERDPRLRSGFDWLHPNLGGLETLRSYGLDVSDPANVEAIHAEAREKVPLAHREFLATLPNYHQAQGLLFVHAGIDPDTPLERQQEDDLVWIRAPFLMSTVRHPWLVVHGHTPVEQPEHHGNRVNLDTGAGYGDDLTTAVFDDGAVSILTAAGRAPLRPT